MTKTGWVMGVLTLFVAVGVGCGDEPRANEENVEIASALSYAPHMHLDTDLTRDAIGLSSTVSPNKIDLRADNPFFHDFGTNGRVCGTCHQEAFGWTITPGFARSRKASDPLFLFDGSDCLPPAVANNDPAANSTEMLSKALIRIDLAIPGTADYLLVSAVDPLACPTPPSAADLRMYRRPLPTANTAFLTTVMWDGRETLADFARTHVPGERRWCVALSGGPDSLALAVTPEKSEVKLLRHEE